LLAFLVGLLSFQNVAVGQGNYTSNTVNSGAGGQTGIAVTVNNTTATSYVVKVNGQIVHEGTVDSKKRFTIPVSTLPANANVQVVGSTSGGAEYTATIVLQP
jgi:hypothetical protein